VSEDAELVIYADPGRGAFRYAGIIGERLEACLLLSGRAEGFPAREDLIASLGGEVAPAARLALLAGCGGGQVATGAVGRTVCSCFAVGLKTLLDTIAERQLTSVAAIGHALRAGTNCGSCIPELAAILRGAQA
jgi:assimilatory nitrate reductase catalytic subunit